MSRSPDVESTHRIQYQGGWAHQIDLPAVHLRVFEGPDAGLQVTCLRAPLRIGTAKDNDLVLTDRTVSKHHAEIRREAGGLKLVDLESRNGTRIGAARVLEVLLDPGARFAVGHTLLGLEDSRETLYAIPTPDDRLGELVGGSATMREIYALIRTVAPLPATVLIEGESGCGKELVARALHQLSGRKGPLTVFDCAGVAPELVASELFGHVRGGFTGAAEAREGLFRCADGGTLFLDELGDLPRAIQPSLLRILETREVKPVGSDRSQRVDVRLIAATNQDLAHMVTEGTFRTELYHRLRVIRIRLPPLRDRAEDVPRLIAHHAATLGLSSSWPPDLMHRLQKYSWPGNVRTLRHAVERAAALCQGRPVTWEDLDLPAADAPDAGGLNLAALERRTIEKALEMTGGNQVKAARSLGMGLSTLKEKLRRWRREGQEGP